MKQINFLYFEKIYTFHKHFMFFFIIVLFSVFSSLYSNNLYAETEEVKKTVYLRFEEDVKAVNLAKRYAERHKEVISILENVGASEKAISLARRRYEASVEIISIIDNNPNSHNWMTPYVRFLEKRSILKDEDFINGLTVLNLAKISAENSKKNVLILEFGKNVGTRAVAIMLARREYEISMEIVSIIKRNTTIP